MVMQEIVLIGRKYTRKYLRSWDIMSLTSLPNVSREIVFTVLVSFL